MNRYSTRSRENLDTAHPLLQDLFQTVLKWYDHTVLEGHRGEEAQNRAAREGKSKLRFPKSKHNSFPAVAVDVAPYPIDWKDRERFYHFAGFVMGVAAMMGIELRWGGDWDGDGDFSDQSFDDLPHFELLNPTSRGGVLRQVRNL